MGKIDSEFLSALTGSVRDLLPIIAVVTFFQLFFIREPFPELAMLLQGLLFVVIGLALFVYGLEQGLFPLGEAMAHALARKGSLAWLLIFGFALGFSTTVAEPALIAIAAEAAAMAALTGEIADDMSAQAAYALRLRLIVAVAVGSAIVIGLLRILKGWPLHYLIIGGYALVMLMASIAPPTLVGIAYDTGGVTTSTITVPLVTALGVGLAMSIEGRNPIVDGFGLVAMASLTPMMFVMAAGILW